MLTGPRATGRSSPNTSMRSTSVTMRSASSQISRVSMRSSRRRRLLEQLRRAADAGQRVLDLMRQHRGQRDHRARRAAMRQLPVHLVGDGALLQHHDDMAGPLGQRRDVQIDLAVAADPRRAEIDLVLVDRRAAALAPDRSAPAAGCRTAPVPSATGVAGTGVEISKNDSAAMLASTILPSGATSSTGLGRALRMASPSERHRPAMFCGWTSCSSAPCKVVKRILQEIDARRCGSSDVRILARQVLSVAAGARLHRPRPPAPSRDACAHGEGRCANHNGCKSPHRARGYS